MNPIKILKYQLYLLQLENYEIERYVKLLFKKGYFYPKQPLRKNLVWTPKAKLVALVALSIIFVGIIKSFWLFDYFGLFILPISFILWPLYLVLAVLVLWVFDFFAKWKIVSKAKRIVADYPDLIIVGVAGSYGKTTMKNVLGTILKSKFQVLVTPDSVNTPVGISRWFDKEFHSGIDVVIIEMGEHYQGDIKYLCSIMPPNFAVVTGINEAHLERLKTIDTATKTVFEIAENMKENGTLVLNFDDAVVSKKYKEFSGGHKVKFYSVSKKEADINITAKNFDAEKLSWEFEIPKIGKASAYVLGEYFLGDITAAIIVAEELGLKSSEIRKGIENIKPVEHRLQPIPGKGNVLVIDDSYNGNSAGVKEAIAVLSRFKDRRKIYLTPGIVETGVMNEKVHTEIGKDLSKVADVVILIKNSATPHIGRALIENGFKRENIILFKTAPEAHAALGTILKPNDVILFQNDWGDQYL